MAFTPQINLRLLKGTFEENSNQEVYEGSTDEDTKNYSRTKRSKGTSWLHGNHFPISLHAKDLPSWWKLKNRN